ncbi:ester cyclase [Caulobacter segnis]|uniref:ester cyclase n=1 Tax=Caulobacter segnis TaxID=88688 RepID=UPI001CBB96FA|nr:ester cyclase [Caulobacter segnis]UAL10172.1 ester cyclase [Caulobacter segnis]
MSSTATLQAMDAMLAAWNARQWDVYVDFHDEALEAVFQDGAAHDRDEHLAQSLSFCAFFADAKIHTEPCLTHFASETGEDACVVARLTGSISAPMIGANGFLAQDRRAFDVTSTLVCRWRQGRVIARRQLITPDLIWRQLAGL